MVDSCWMKFSVIRKWLRSALDQKSFQELVLKAFKNRKRSGCVDRQQVRSIDRNLFFFKLKLLIFRRWWQLWMKSTTIKQGIGWIYFSYCFARLFYCRTRWVNWLTIDVNVSLLLKLRLHTCMHTNNCVCVFMFALAKWPAADQGFQITKWPAVWHFSQILRNRRDPSNSNYHMSIKNCQAIQKSCIVRKSNAWFTFGSDSETMVCDTISLGWLPVTVFKSLNDRQSDIFLKFKESKEPIQFKLSYVD